MKDPINSMSAAEFVKKYPDLAYAIYEHIATDHSISPYDKYPADFNKNEYQKMLDGLAKPFNANDPYTEES